jgi:HEAT repeat protein
LRDPDREVREQACDALGAMADPASASALVVATLDAEAVVRHAASRSLQRVDPYWERLASVREVLPTVRQAVDHSDYGVQKAAIDILKRCGEIPAGSSHTTVATTHRRRRTAEEVLVRMLEDTDAALRQAALECLIAHGASWPEAVQQKLVKDADASVRHCAQEGVRQVQNQGASV